MVSIIAFITSLLALSSLLTRAPVRVTDGVHEYVEPGADYCANFGRQWNEYRDVQIDSLSGDDESCRRFYSETGWSPDGLRGRVLLDAGCGAGRFAEVAVAAGARVVAVDLSEAAYACQRTLSKFPPDRFLVVRADISRLPLRPASFDGVYALGVLQHTPDPLAHLRALAESVAPGGTLATWIYERRRPDIRWLQVRTWLRRALRDLTPRQKLACSRTLVAAFFPIGWPLSWAGRSGEVLSHFLPYAARHHLGRGSLRRQWTYSVMDTFDWYGPRYDLPQREEDVAATMRDAGLISVRRLPARGMAITAVRPRAGGNETA